MLMDRQERRDHAEVLMILAQQLADLVAATQKKLWTGRTDMEKRNSAQG
jgi:hypothetical protein